MSQTMSVTTVGNNTKSVMGRAIECVKAMDGISNPHAEMSRLRGIERAAKSALHNNGGPMKSQQAKLECGEDDYVMVRMVDFLAVAASLAAKAGVKQ